MGQDPRLEVPDVPADLRFRVEKRAELRLIAGSAQKDDHHPRYGHRDVAPQILLDERQRQVDPRGNPARGVHMPVADEDEIRLDAERWVELREAVAEHPVGGNATVIQQAGRRQQEGAGADRGDATDARRRGSQPIEQRLVGAGGLGAHPADNDQRVEPLGDVWSQPWVATICRPLWVRTEARRRSDDQNFVARFACSSRLLQVVVGIGKRAQGTANVQRLDVGVDQRIRSCASA